MANTTETIERAAQSGLGVLDARDLQQDQDAVFGWQRPRVPVGESTQSYAGQEFTNGHGQIEVAMPREGTPQGTGYTLIRDSSNPTVVLVFAADRWRQLCDGIRDGQYDLSD
jgi:hypothetical protein